MKGKFIVIEGIDDGKTTQIDELSVLYLIVINKERF